MKGLIEKIVGGAVGSVVGLVEKEPKTTKEKITGFAKETGKKASEIASGVRKQADKALIATGLKKPKRTIWHRLHDLVHSKKK